jgi:hypothetical protein
MRQQLGEPLTVAGVRLPPRHGLDLKRIGEDQLKVTFQRLPDRFPIDAGRLHRDMPHLSREQPETKIAESFEVGRELLFTGLRTLALRVNEYAGGHRVFVDIDTATAGI